MKRPREEDAKASRTELSKTERRRQAKKAKKEKQRNSRGKSVVGRPTSMQASRTPGSGDTPQEAKGVKSKLTKEQRRAKYTRKAYQDRERRKQAAPNAHKTRCLGCRAWGHVVANCPEAKANIGICFNCGSTEHALRACPEPKREDGTLPFAKCFLCKKEGHITAQCKENTKGIYPKGGSCKECGSKYHLWSNCPDRAEHDVIKRDKATSVQDSDSTVLLASGGKVQSTAAAVTRQQETTPAGQVTRVKRRRTEPSGTSTRGGLRPPGGDDLEDDDYYQFGGDDDKPHFGEHAATDGTAQNTLKSFNNTAGVRRKASKVVVF